MVSVQHRHSDDRIFHKEALSLLDLGHQLGILHADRIGTEPEVEGLEWIRIPAVNGIQAGLKKLYLGRFYDDAGGLGAAFRPDVVIAHEPQSVSIGLRIAKETGAEMIFDSHESYHFTNWKDRWALRYHIPQVQNYLAVNAMVENDIRGVRADAQVAIIRNCSVIVGSLVEDMERIVICHEGYLTFDRGLKLLLESAVDLLERHEHVDMLIVGQLWGEEADYFEAEKRHRPVLNRIHLTGWLTYDDVPSALSMGSIGLILNEPTPNNLYSSPNKLFNYIASNMAVVSTPLPFIEEIIEQYGCGVVLADRSATDLVDTLSELIDDPDRLRGLREASHRAHEELKWENEAPVLDRFVRKVFSDNQK